MVVLHHLENSRSQRIAWALELLGVEYEVKTYLRTPEKMAPETLRRIHPLGHAPVLEDGEITIAESGAILEFLVDEYDPEKRLKPQTKAQRCAYHYWLHFAEGSFMPLLTMMLIFRKIAAQPMPFFVRPIAKSISNKVVSGFIEPRLRDVLSLIEDHLSQNHWFVGDKLSAADIQMSFPILAMNATMSLENYPHIERWVASVRKDPAYQRAVARVGEFQVF